MISTSVLKAVKGEAVSINNFADIRREFADYDKIICGDRTRAEFIKATQAVGDCLKALPLTADQNNTLIELIGLNMAEAERGAFLRGFDLGVRVAVGAEQNDPLY